MSGEKENVILAPDVVEQAPSKIYQVKKAAIGCAMEKAKAVSTTTSDEKEVVNSHNNGLDKLLWSLPVELLEPIIFQLDGFDLRNLKLASETGKETLTWLLDCDKGIQILKDATLLLIKNTSNPTMFQIVASFNNIVLPGTRNALQKDLLRQNVKLNYSDDGACHVVKNERTRVIDFLTNRGNALDKNWATWAYAFDMENAFIRIVSQQFPPSFEVLVDVERTIKENLEHFYAKNLTWRHKSPRQFILTAGSNLVHIMSPMLHEYMRLFIYENLRTLRHTREAIRFGGQKTRRLYSCGIEYIVMNDINNTEGNKLPKIYPTLIVKFPGQLLFCRIPNGYMQLWTSNFISPLSLPYHFIPQYAIYGKYMAIIEDLTNLRIYRLLATDNLNLDINIKFTGISLMTPLFNFWSKMAMYPDSFVYTLRRDFDLPVYPYEMPPQAPEESLENHNFVFTILSSKLEFVQCGNEEIRVTERNDIKVLGESLFNQMKQPNLLFKYGTLLAWEKGIFGCAFGKNLWVFNKWHWFFKKPAHFRRMMLVEIIAHNTLMICTSPGYSEFENVDFIIVIAKLEFNKNLQKSDFNFNNAPGEWPLDLKVLREIPVQLEVPYIISKIQFDFEQGQPYILVTADYNYPELVRLAQPKTYCWEEGYCPSSWRYIHWGFPPGYTCDFVAPVYDALRFKLIKITFENFEDHKNGIYFVNDFPPETQVEKMEAPGERMAKLLQSLDFDDDTSDSDDDESNADNF